MPAKTGALPEELGKAETLLAGNGCFSEANVKACEAAKAGPLLAISRDSHHRSLSERFAGAPPAPENPTPVEGRFARLNAPPIPPHQRRKAAKLALLPEFPTPDAS
jgi:hypothetical protein